MLSCEFTPEWEVSYTKFQAFPPGEKEGGGVGRVRRKIGRGEELVQWVEKSLTSL